MVELGLTVYAVGTLFVLWMTHNERQKTGGRPTDLGTVLCFAWPVLIVIVVLAITVHEKTIGPALSAFVAIFLIALIPPVVITANFVIPNAGGAFFDFGTVPRYPQIGKLFLAIAWPYALAGIGIGLLVALFTTRNAS